ncbi:MAG: DUF4943 domain-containing protein [Bacteroides sp.]|nr:DUF4943 domain-containing protein [Bacteroides sp.]
MKKTLMTLLVLCSLFLVSSCSDETLDYYNPEVKLFVKQLKAGTYNTTNEMGVVEVPKFTQKHIPLLLRYVDDTAEIPSFPLRSMTSHFGGKPRLGECMLWIIEGIRLGHDPSMGCKLVTRDADNYDGMYFLDNNEIVEAAKLYRNWWEKVENPNPIWSVDLWLIDPLHDSNYRWW